MSDDSNEWKEMLVLVLLVAVFAAVGLAAECDRMCKEASDIGVASRYVHVREGQAMLASAFGAVAEHLRALPEVPAGPDTDVGDGEGEAL